MRIDIDTITENDIEIILKLKVYDIFSSSVKNSPEKKQKNDDFENHRLFFTTNGK